MLTLKDGRLTGAPPESLPSQIAAHLRRSPATTVLFSPFLAATSVIVPVPKSSLQKEDSLWVPAQLAAALVHAGFGSRAASLLNRSEAIPKAATSDPGARPDALRHYRTLAVQKDLGTIRQILLVDDVVTSGTTLLGSANRLADAYPGVPIRCFAAMRTESDPAGLTALIDPVVGEITLRPNGKVRRRP
ncbi:MAG: hypothetical protein WAK40_08300 [Thermoplasmata archaeon]